jgi:hypothetical protein
MSDHHLALTSPAISPTSVKGSKTKSKAPRGCGRAFVFGRPLTAAHGDYGRISFCCHSAGARSPTPGLVRMDGRGLRLASAG